MTNPPLIFGPVPAYNNPPIQPQFYKPSLFFISAITTGQVTTITTTANMNYVIGQECRLLIPRGYGSQQVNEQTGFVISIPSANQVVLDLNSSSADQFIYNPVANFSVALGGTGQGNILSIIKRNYPLSMVVPGTVTIIAAGPTTYTDPGMDGTLSPSGTIDYLTGQIVILAAASQTVSATFNYFPSTTKPQIVAIGDQNSGNINTSGTRTQPTFIPGSFINISPN